MSEANFQNTKLKIREELDKCSYCSNTKDYIERMIIQIVNYPKKIKQPKYFVINMNKDKIMKVSYQMSVPFINRNYNIPIHIYIMKNIPIEPPRIFLEVPEGIGLNRDNENIDRDTKQIKTNTLINWNESSNIGNVMDEIYQSFLNYFPLYKEESRNSSREVEELKEQIKSLKHQLENEIQINKNLKDIIIEKEISYNNILKENKSLTEANQRLNNELSLYKKKKQNNNELPNYEELVLLYKKIEDLNDKLARYPIDLLKGEKLISVIFTFENKKVTHSIICKNTSKFNRLVGQLYNYYPEYSKDNNIFISNGKMINMFKTLDENGIHENDIIILKKK